MYDVSPMVQMKIAELPDDKKQQFAMHFHSVQKDANTALICAIFGVSQLYFGQIGKFILYFFTGGGFFIWWIILIVNAKTNVQKINDAKAVEILMMLT